MFVPLEHFPFLLLPYSWYCKQGLLQKLSTNGFLSASFPSCNFPTDADAPERQVPSPPGPPFPWHPFPPFDLNPNQPAGEDPHPKNHHPPSAFQLNLQSLGFWTKTCPPADLASRALHSPPVQQQQETVQHRNTTGVPLPAHRLWGTTTVSATSQT